MYFEKKEAGAVMSRKFLCLTSFVVLFLLAGCADKELKVPLEDVGMVGIMAFDYIDEDKTQLTVAIPQYSPQAEQNTQIFSVATDLVSNGIVEIEKLSDKKNCFQPIARRSCE